MVDQWINVKLMDCFDSSISQNQFSVTIATSYNDWGPSAPRMNLTISNNKLGRRSAIYLDYNQVNDVIAIVKGFKDEIPSMISLISKQSDKTFSYLYKTNKMRLFMDFLFRVEMNSVCSRIVITDRDKDIMDSEKFYFSIKEFVSVIRILTEYRDNYIKNCFEVNNLVKQDIMITGITDLKNRIHFLNQVKDDINEYRMGLTSAPKIDNVMKDDRPEMVEFELDVSTNTDTKKQADVIENFDLRDSKDVQVEEEIVIDPIQVNFNDYATKQRDSMVIDGLVEVKKHPEAIIEFKDSIFTHCVLSNSIENLENIISISSLDDEPFNKFYQLIKTKMYSCGEIYQKEILPELTAKDFSAMNLLINLTCKYHVNRFINKIQLPQSITPIVYKCENSDKLNHALMTDLLLYMIYYKLLRTNLGEKDLNYINTKEHISFCLKNLVSPFIFSFFKSTKSDLIVNTVGDKYTRYQELGVFKSIEDKCFEIYGEKINIPRSAINGEVSKIYDLIIQKYDQLLIHNIFDVVMKKMNFKIKYSDFDFVETRNVSTIQKLEFFHLSKTDGMFDKTPVDISDLNSKIISIYDPTSKIITIDNLKKYIDRDCKDVPTNQYITNKLKQISKNCFDIDELDYQIVPESCLKAIALWRPELDAKIHLDFKYFERLVDSSSLDHNLAMSLLSDKKQTSEDFYNAFLVTR